MSIIWKHNGQEVSCREAIPSRSSGVESIAVRGNYKKPIELLPMGFIAHPEDVAEHRKRFPAVDLQMHEGSAIPVVKSLSQKRAYLSAAGWADTKSY